MLVIEKDDTREWPVKVKEPVDGGKHRTVKFTAIFKKMPKSQTAELIKEAREKAEESNDIIDADALILREVLVGLKGVSFDDEEPSEEQVQEIIDWMIDDAQYTEGLMQAYKECRGRSDVKN